MTENGAFISKPARGWLHPDSVLATDGITYAVRVSSLLYSFFSNLFKIRATINFMNHI